MTKLVAPNIERGIQGVALSHLWVLCLIMLSVPTVTYAVLFLSNRSERAQAWAWFKASPTVEAVMTGFRKMGARMHLHAPLGFNHRGSRI